MCEFISHPRSLMCFLYPYNFEKIMKQTCKVSIGADIIEAVQGLQVNIPDSLDYARIKDTSVPAHYNGQKQPCEVGSRISEPFDVIEFDRSYTKIRKLINDDKFKNKDE